MGKKLKSAAILTVHDASNFSKDGKRRVIAWLQRQINFLKKHNKKLSKRFTARYQYEG